MHLGNSATKDLTRSVKLAREISGLAFGVYIGELPQGRESGDGVTQIIGQRLREVEPA